jgi:hypothetical protein
MISIEKGADLAPFLLIDFIFDQLDMPLSL